MSSSFTQLTTNLLFQQFNLLTQQQFQNECKVTPFNELECTDPSDILDLNDPHGDGFIPSNYKAINV